MKRLLAVLTGILVVLVGSVAVAAWLSVGSGAAQAAATTVDRANQPDATRGAGQVTLTWGASTLASGAPVAGYRVLRHEGANTTTVCTAVAPDTTCDDTAPVAGEVEYGVVATIGTQWVGAESPTTSFTYDATAPVTTAQLTPVPNAAGWNKDAVQVALSATDAGSGVKELRYVLDGSEMTTVPAASTTVPVSGTGTHTIGYYAVDNAGNAEVQKTSSVRIDPAAPSTAVVASPAANAAGWNNSNVTLSFTATDNGPSGVKSIAVDGVDTAGATASRTVAAEGDTSVSFSATDVADNVEAPQTARVRIDKTAPSSVIDPTSSTAWTNDSSVTILSTDARSGVASLWYRVDGAAPQTVAGGTASFVLSDGTHSVTYRATDAAGNQEAERSATLKVDSAAPTASMSLIGNTWVLNASDASPSSGGLAVEYWIDAGSHTTATQLPVYVTVPAGTHTLHYRAIDGAGNVQPEQTTVATADLTAPSISSFYPGNGADFRGSGTNKWNSAPCGARRLCASASDAGTGVLVVKYVLSRRSDNYCWSGSAWVVTCPPISMTLASGSSANGVWRSEEIPLEQIQVGVDRTYDLWFQAIDVPNNASTSSGSFTAR